MTEHPSLETPGGLIRAARVAKGLNLAELSERTKIPPPVIDAIERDEYHKVSGALYIKSFLRTCAVELGLETEEVLELYGSFSGESRSMPGGPDTVWEENKVQISHIGLPWRSIGLVGGALVVVGLAVLLVMRGCGDGTDVPNSAEPSLPAAPVGQLSGQTEDTEDTEEAEEPATVLSDTAEVPAHESLLVRQPARRPAGTDSLASGWVSSRPSEDPAADAGQIEEPAGTEAVVQEMAAPQKQDVVATPAVATSGDGSGLPLPLVGGPGLVFAGGQQKALVLRIIFANPVGVQVKQDAQQSFEGAIWPAVGAAARPLPPTGIEAGRVYGVRRGLVAYWGADDHISLRLDRTEGVEASLNGKQLDVSNLRAGGEMLLDNHGN